MQPTRLAFLIRIAFWAVLFIVAPQALLAQKFHFTRYDIQNGLSQSQVTAITQDVNNYLLVSTMDGVDRFDGKTFANYTEDNGLRSNTTYALYAAKNGMLWMAHKKGVTSFDGVNFKHYTLNGKPIAVRQVLVDNQNVAWALAKQTLYKAANGRLLPTAITAAKDTVLCISLNNAGVLHALILGKGLYSFSKGKWRKIYIDGGLPLDRQVKNIVFDPVDSTRAYLYSAAKIFSLQNGQIALFKPDVLKQIKQQILCIRPVKDGMWIGMGSGAVRLKGDQLTFYDESNGFTYYPVPSIYQDKDANVWFATNGDGLYCFREDSYLTLDRDPNGMDLLVMGMAYSEKGGVYFAGSGSGLLRFKDNKLKPAPGWPNKPDMQVLNGIFVDSQNNLIVSSANKTLWKLKERKAEQIYPSSAADKPLSATSITEDKSHTLWFATSSGCYYQANSRLIKVQRTEGYYACIKAVGKGMVLAGNNNGVSVIKANRITTDKRFDFLKGLYVLSIAKQAVNIYFGTFEKGIYSINLSNGLVKHYTRQNGLSSNSIYSIAINGKYLWAGTGRGINRFQIEANGNLMLSKSPFDGLVVECNQNSIAFDGKRAYFGTTRGVYITDTDLPASQLQPPRTILSDIKIYLNDAKHVHTPLKKRSIYNGLKLPYDNSHITFHFDGIQLTEPDGVKYRYQLISSNDTLNQVTAYEYADFVTLKPGRYQFKVTAFLPDSAAGNTVSFPFEILPAFYQTTWFKILMVFLTIIVLIGGYKYVQYLNNRKQRKLRELRLAEQEKVRRQTAEDFHDDLGNKLTRITVLSEVLESKARNGQTDTGEIVSQIKASATELYAGTKDILWSLNPENDKLNEIITFIEKFAFSFLEHTKISFELSEVKGPFTNARLPIGYGRNLTLIFKELLNNVVKHANASAITMTVTISTDRMVSIVIVDNGRSFDAATVSKGHGLKNIRNRVKKMNGSIHISNPPGGGTRIKVNFHIPVNNI